MTTNKTSTLDPQMQVLVEQLIQAFNGGAEPTKGFSVETNKDATQLAAAFLSAYHQAALINPSKAIKPKEVAAPTQLQNPENIGSQKFWSELADVVRVVGPIVAQIANKDYKPVTPDFKSIIAGVPEARRNDESFVRYASELLFTGAQTCILSLSGSKDFSDPKNLPTLPTPPAGADKAWYNDVASFIADAAPVVLPIVMSLI
jgi:hypothetical protein